MTQTFGFLYRSIGIPWFSSSLNCIFFLILIIYNKKKCNSCKIVSLQDPSAGPFQIILSIPRNMYIYSDTVDNTINEHLYNY